MEFEMKNFFIGLGLALSSCLFIGSSFIIKKRGLLRLRSSSTMVSAADGGFGYLRDWVWWLGLITMGIGEAANFGAYVFAPATLVTPLGALSILVSALLAPIFLNESMNILGKLGCLLCILGSTIIVIHSPKETDVSSIHELNQKISESGFIYYILTIVVLTLFTIKFIVPRYGKDNVVIYIFICSSIGSLSVMCCKGLGLCIKESLLPQSSQPFFNKSSLLFTIALLVCVTIQMNYLNKALDTFNTAVVNPTHYIFFTSFVMLSSFILFQEWRRIAFLDIFASLVGLIVVIVALFLMSAFKDLHITLSDVYVSKNTKVNIF